VEHALQVLTEDFGPFEWLITWVFLFIAPTASLMMAISSFREKETEQGGRWLIAGLVLTALFGWFLVGYGRLMLQLTVRTTGTWVKGVLIAGAIALVALPFGLVGYQLRLAVEYRRRGDGTGRGRRALIIGCLGLVGMAALMYGLYSYAGSLLAAIVSILAVVVVVLGWFGRFLAPEVLPEEDDRDDVERPTGVRGERVAPLPLGTGTAARTPRPAARSVQEAPLPPSQPIEPPRFSPSVPAPAHVQSAGLPAWQDNMGLTIVPDNVRRIEQLTVVRCESDESSYDGFLGVLGDGLQVALIASPFGRRAAYVFDLTTGKKTHETRDFLTLSPDCRFAAIRLDSVPGESAFNVAVLDTSSWRSVREFRQKGGRGWSVAFSTDNSSLALIFSLENLLKKATVLEVRAIVSGTAVLRMNLPTALQGIPEFVSDRELLLCTPDSVALLDIFSGKTVWTLAVPREGIIGMDRSRSRLYVKMQNDHRTHVVHVHTGRDILVLDKMELPLQSRCTLVTPDGQMIVDHDENLLTFFSTWTGERLYQLPLSRCNGLHFTPNGRALLVLYYNEIRILGVRAKDQECL